MASIRPSEGLPPEGIKEVLANYHELYTIQDSSQFAVIKIGGELLDDPEQQELIAEDLHWLTEVGLYPVVLHGGGVQIDRKLKEQGIDTSKDDGIRSTSPIASLVIPGVLSDINASLVESINATKTSASGITEGVFSATISDPNDFASIDELKTSVLAIKGAIAEKRIPVVSCAGTMALTRSVAIKYLQPVNINADNAAGALAVALGVKKYISLTRVGAVLDDKLAPIPRLTAAEAEQMIASGHIDGGMIPKVRQAIELISQGIEHAVIASPENLLAELFTDKGSGTLIKR